MGERPRGPCMYMISRKSTAKLARPWNSEASSDADMVGTRKIDSGSIGSATRRSMSTKTPRVQVAEPRAADGHAERPADPLQDAEADDRRLVPGQCAGQRAEHEDGEAHLVHPDPAEHVAEPIHLRGQQRDHEQEADDD